jgi:hypothetical protein
MKARLILICSIFLLFPVVLFSAESPDQNGNQTISIDKDGSSFEKAVIIKYIGDYRKSIHQEYEYLAEEFGIRGKDWRLKLQALVEENGRFYDKMTVEFPNQETKILYFDITEPFTELNKQLAPAPK